MKSIFFALAVLLITGCNIAPSKGTIAAHDISGIVTDKLTGRPIEGVTICSRYAKLGMRFYVRGNTQTDSAGQFKIPANPEEVFLLDTPRGQIPSLSFMHPSYHSAMVILKDFNNNRVLNVQLKPSDSGQEKSQYIDCRDSGKKPES